MTQHALHHYSVQSNFATEEEGVQRKFVGLLGVHSKQYLN